MDWEGQEPIVHKEIIYGLTDIYQGDMVSIIIGLETIYHNITVLN